MEQLNQIIRAEIAAKRVIPFKRFMELALYCPEYGYYEKEKDNVGRGGDFYTSVSVGGLFGDLLASQFASWLDALNSRQGKADFLTLAEAGAHQGRLALDILRWFKQFRPDHLKRLRYLLLEPSASRQTWQLRVLEEFRSQVVWQSGLDSNPIRGIIFSNELLDAMPLTRARWNACDRKWQELGVTSRDGLFAWKLMQGSLCLPWDVPEPLLQVLPDGFIVEFSQAATDWWRNAAATLQEGWLVTFDYGCEWEDFFEPSRKDGTLRTYRKHRMGVDPLADPGEQDLTAHVNFSEILRGGEEAGLRTEVFTSQSAFLSSIARELIERQLPFPPWTSKRLRQLQTLTHPQSLGASFRILAQTRRGL